jgi:threonine/homoserine/homoserine lactone efflux protein
VQDALAYAIGIAISPVAIGAIVLLLSRPTPLRVAAAFAAGWIAGVGTQVVVLATAVNRADITDADPSVLAIAELAIGACFLIATARIWQGRRERQNRGTAVLAALDAASTGRTATLGLVLSGANPKVWALSLAAVIGIAAESSATLGQAWQVAALVAIGSAGVLVPLAAYAAAPDRAQPPLMRFRAWLGRHETGVLLGVGLLIGVLFLREGAVAFV